ncbi:aminotransferase-like domain-containing protein [Paenibacillus sp. Leaf72]|uniref:aminotransferase-like domain-containing protein n=1 Tax=Paenibacillus sp. Leaf72 TaxID=1736234 RepID=UPI00070212A6|nr:PLP-dependent aminotransferase family protein [Paenibacillus sp. Leaf72]KQO01115.1 aminotransferase 4 [Paenibacillus sp. Leaf72]
MGDKLAPFRFAKRVPQQAPMGAAQASNRTDVVPLSYGSPASASFPYDALQQAASDAIQTQGHAALQYSGADGPAVVRQWIAERSVLRGIHAAPQEVLVTYGSGQAIDFACRAILEPGDHVWVEAPTFFGALNTFRSSEAVLTSFPIDEQGLRVDLVEEALEQSARANLPLPKLLYCIPNYHNPGGISLSLSRRKRLAELALAYNFFILEDDAYSELNFGAVYLPAIYSFAPQRTIYLGTFSKTIAPSIRLGWAIASQDTAGKLGSFFHGSRASAFTQQIIGNLLSGYSLETHIEQLIARYREQRDSMLAALDKHLNGVVEYAVPEGGFFVWLRFKEEVDTGELVTYATERGVSFIDGRQFYLSPEDGKRYARLSFSYCEGEVLELGIIRLAEAYQDYRDDQAAQTV